jgi:hypothetical protein
MLASQMFVLEITFLEISRLAYIDSKLGWVKVSDTRLDGRIDHFRLVDDN